MPDSAVNRRVWIISEGSPGHVSQTRGMADALARLHPVSAEVIETRPRMNGLTRQLVRRWMGGHGRPLPLAMAGPLLRCRNLPAGRPDLVITSGGKAVFAARTLAAHHGTPLVFVGERKPYPAAWFHTVFTPSPMEIESNDVPVELVPTAVTPALVARAAAEWSTMPRGRLWAMIVGGSSTSHRYHERDWQELAAAMNALAERHGIRWLLSTSRRTGTEAEAILRSAIHQGHLATAVWWAGNPEKCLLRFLGACERAFVTQDSITMVTEAVESGKPVVVTCPRETVTTPDGFLARYHQRLEAAGRTLRAPIANLHAHDPAAFDHHPRRQTAADEIAAMLLPRLGWTRMETQGLPS